MSPLNIVVDLRSQLPSSKAISASQLPQTSDLPAASQLESAVCFTLLGFYKLNSRLFPLHQTSRLACLVPVHGVHKKGVELRDCKSKKRQHEPIEKAVHISTTAHSTLSDCLQQPHDSLSNTAFHHASIVK
ncbi:hypothetical protein ACOSP7_016783 [Xanthoceras sorbifolium]